MIAENLKARAEQFTPRINAAVNDALGPDFNAPTKMAALKVATRLNGSAYGPILNSGATVDVTPVRDMIANARVDPILAGVKEDPISSALHDLGGSRHIPSLLTKAHLPSVEWFRQKSGVLCRQPTV